MTNNVFSEYEVNQMGIKFANDLTYSSANCVGSVEENLEVRVVTKKCRGVVAKTRVTGAGNGTLNISLHIPYEIFNTAYGMKLNTLVEGVRAYGTNSRHAEFSLVEYILDEDGDEKYKAYPKCIIQSALSRTTENGADEVAEIELEISVMPDEYGNCMYEALAKNISDEIAKAWMTEFTPDLVKKRPETLTVTYTLENITSSNTETTVEKNSDYSTTLTTGEGYSLPATIAITVGGEILQPVSGDTGDYNYEKSTGEVFIPADKVTGDIVITATGMVSA